MGIELHLRIAGAIMMGLGLSFLFFNKRFNWKEDLAKVSLLTRQMFYIHTYFIALLIFLNGVISFFFADALLEKSQLALGLSGALTFFWLSRLFIQLFVYSPELWRGNAFNTRVHVVFTLFWIYFSAVFGFVITKHLQHPD
jgi:hypothetical protein